MLDTHRHSAPTLAPPTAARHGYWVCTGCTALCAEPASAASLACPRCGTTVHRRKPSSVARCWALLIAATALYVPANLLPVTVTTSLLDTQSDTILSGIAYLWQEGSWLLAALVFVASILVPLFKLLFLSLLLISVQRRSSRSPQGRTRVYRALEFVGRWSMLDIYVITWLAALVQMKSLATITPGPGAMAFAAVVVLTMLATRSFDPRLIWDPLTPADAARAATPPTPC